MAEAAAEVARRGLPVERFHAKHLLRRQVPLSPEVLVVGEVHVVESALTQLGREVPSENCYPEVLRPYLLRRVWPSTIGAVTGALMSGQLAECFLKPRGRIKTLTGRMMDASDVGQLMQHAASTAVWCAELVSFRSEHRAFVIDGQVRALRLYGGDAELPDESLVRTCVDAWTASGQAASAYAIDFGVLRDGRTALLEVNDGYSLGTYGCPPEVSVELLMRRWTELMGTSALSRD
jgi:hypothetical protein